jgi:hypothetical protein
MQLKLLKSNFNGYIGMKTQSMASSSTVNITMIGTELEGVVVTALGKEKKALGYATQVSGEGI